jgi:diketogulonate reductase-like aldo/keto reductase
MKTASINTAKLPSGKRVPAFGLGTWYMGEDPATHAEELATLRLGLDMGATLVDTAEIYGEGCSEKLVGEAIEGRRDEVFLVDKVLPQNASLRRMSKACEASLRRIGTDRIDLYLLHWRGEVPLLETVEAFEQLRHDGKILSFGVSNFDTADMDELWSIPGGTDTQTDQVLYNLTRRGIEWDLRPWLREHHVPVMAYSPIERSKLVTNQKLIQFAGRHEMTPAQVALSWLFAKPDVIVIPKASQREHLIENLGALEHPLSRTQLAELDRLFPAPSRQVPLEMI